MGDALIGLGVLLAILGPLLLIPVIWLLYRGLWWALSRRSPSVEGTSRARMIALALSIILVVGVMLASYYPGYREYERLCAKHSVPEATFRTRVDSFYRAQMFPYQAAKYLEQDSFSFVEAPDPYKEGVLLRYFKASNGEVQSEQISAVSSAYGFRETFSELPGGITMTEKVIYEIATDRELARAASVTYDGGPLSLFLGSYGMSACPDIRTEEGSRHFTTFYDLESIVLRGGASE